MTRLVKSICAILIVLYAFQCAGCSNDLGEVIVQDAGQYLQVNDYVREELSVSFSGFLPANNIIEYHDAQYYYSYNCSLLGEPNFAVYLRNKFQDNTKFLQEKERLANLSDGNVPAAKHGIVYYAGDLATASNLYADEEIRDGLCIRFELAIVDDEKNTIQYLVAEQQDNNKQLDVILNILEIVAQGKTGVDSLS